MELAQRLHVAHRQEGMLMKEFLARCAQAVLVGDRARSADLATETLAAGHDILAVVEDGFSAGVRAAGAKWNQGEYFLPELAFAGEAMKAAMAILQPELRKGGGGQSKGRVLMGTVQGDSHDIGKSLVSTLLLANNYEVIDLGADVPHRRFVEEVEKQRPDFVGMSALLTTTMAGQGEVVRLPEQRGLRDSVKVLVGGAPTSAQWAREIGADGHGGNAVAAVQALDALR
jgi:corrinoid protein of di/trimethylamine methyltransferase